ncbi:MAG: alpha/beta hydrolase [Alphaproteobacteria bacterium]|uniref:alpha/beta fold hydrolase n=1 Tax=Maricaulis alexandrii TaxID=2570354 RepID=UPI00148704CF|nr:alpha/beta hydrolase [Maricaulis alexandrii]MCR9266359.1 alpha/beta hydrolase [Alphaproteobacteria bacterium]
MSDEIFPFAHLDSPTGASLALHTREASAPVRGIVHINHGLAERAGRYGKFADFLSSRGYHVAAHDHRGHGRTTAKDGGERRFADVDGWDKLITDVAVVEGELRNRWPGLPLVVFGHSMGSVIAFNHVMRAHGSLAGAAIWNGNMALGGLKSVMRFVLWCEALIGGDLTPSNTLDKLTFKAWNKRFPEGRTDADWLSSDTDEVDAYVADELCGWPSSVSLWRDFLDGVEAAEKMRNLKDVPRDFPFHLIGGSLDPATNKGQAVQTLADRLGKAGFTDVSCKILEGFRHETINETGREKPLNDFADWLDRVTANASA